ncbi:choice-of-anchor A family protein [Streptomyces sp. WAC00288]|nr:choice-of-anchor A family protein [Streptomyces sp. WAC00288]KYG56173.1 hypothetical protein AWI43_18675 [Streptomyces sp. WAC04657]
MSCPYWYLVTNPLGAVGLYAEFVEKDSVRHSDSEGAVAVGGDAYFGDPAKPSGFSVGSRLTAADPAELPGGHSVVVGGTLYANNVVLDKGTGVAGEVVNRSTPGRGLGVDGDKVRTGTSPVDFGKEFTELRKLSTGWAGVRPDGEVSADPSGQGVFLTGTDAKLNVFAVKASDLERAGAISLKVPAGSSTLVNVLGGSYDMHAEPTYGVWIWDENTKGFVQDDYNSGSDAFKQVRSKLLWNLPQAETVKKNHSSWPGTILAPDAAVSTGSASYGPGHVNGSVIAEPPKPTETPVPTPTATTPTSSATTPGTPSGTPSTTAPAGTPEETPTTPAPSATPEGDLATTGSSVGPGVIGAGAAVVLAGGALLAFAKRRRRAS